MKISIITPTYKREQLLARCLESVLKQTYQNWELIIIDDSGEKDNTNFHLKYDDKRITYLRNDSNFGVNFSRNRALTNISDTDFFMFLDDDDYFSSNEELYKIYFFLETHKDITWMITNKITYNNSKINKITSIKQSKEYYNYERDYLFSNNIKGDATHILKWNDNKDFYFPKTVKNGCEFIFWLGIGKRNRIHYTDFNTTISEYLSNGLTCGTSGATIRKNLFLVTKEVYRRKLLSGITSLYIVSNYINSFIFIQKLKKILGNKQS